jgi:hypothetical protein
MEKNEETPLTSNTENTMAPADGNQVLVCVHNYDKTK